MKISIEGGKPMFLRRRWLIVTTLLISFVWVAFLFPQADFPREGVVVSVYDGDTFTLAVGEEKFSCRLLGIDAPELSYSRLWTEMAKVTKYTPPRAKGELEEGERVFRQWAEVLEKYARQSREVLKGLTLGREVVLTYDHRQPKKDQYGRLLVYVSVGDVDANAELIRRGLAVADTRFPGDRLDGYVKLWHTAQANHLGLWSLH